MDILKDILLYSEAKPLLFTKFYFWGFFAFLLLIYSFIYKKNPLRNAYLFFMSLFFYYKSGGYFFSLIIFSTIADFTLGQLIYRANTNLRKKLFVATSIIINLCLLGYFKYTYFFTDIINSTFNTDFEVINFLASWTNNLTGSSFNLSRIILPVGISFYTFQTISYTVDVYRGKLKPVRNIIDFGFYVSFFPQLIAGPIVRAAEFIPQLYQKFKLTKQEFGHAAFLILNGLVKKMLISDYISINFVDRVFESPLSFTGFENLMAVYGYSIQIYCDFSGYTDIAIGVALLLGFKLPVNFNSPYKAINITDFWQRWHISLSSWLRDYLYIPLGGNRKGKTRLYINLMITMLLGGLWHGASLRFIIWGGLHGLGLVIHKLWVQLNLSLNKHYTSRSSNNLFYRFVSVFTTFNLVTFAWIFFRAESMESAFGMIKQITGNFQINLVPVMISSYYKIFFLIVLGFAIHWLPAGFKENYRGWFIKSNIFVKILLVVVIIFILYQVKSSELQPFIYFQF
ncbi:MAG: MBOAT family protein [Bacteroidales bacterium]|jgi:alginate O-acetyltransferase complex protein AlgI|nr:MBOAT family protein [Bacteroidales bacterium]